MTELPPRDIDDEINFRIERVKFELEKQYEQKTAQCLSELETSYANAQSRFQWWTTGFGAMAIALVAVWAGSRIDTQVTTATAEIDQLVQEKSHAEAILATASIEAVLINRLDEQLNEQTSSLNDRLDEERAISTLLPLVVGEAIDIDDDGLRGGDSIELVQNALRIVGPEIAELDDVTKELALRRLQRILHSFDKFGDYHNVHRIFDLMPATLQEDMLSHDGILHTVSSALAQEFIEKNFVPENRSETLGLILAQSPDPDKSAIERVGLLRVVISGVEFGWGSENMQEQIAAEMARERQGFQSVNLDQMCFMSAYWQNDRGTRNSAARDRTIKLAAQFDLDLAIECTF